MSENEELFGKVKAAQTLSRKDSLKSRHLETELTHMKDEFERLKAEYDETRTAMAAIDVRNAMAEIVAVGHFYISAKVEIRPPGGQPSTETVRGHQCSQGRFLSASDKPEQQGDGAAGWGDSQSQAGVSAGTHQ